MKIGELREEHLIEILRLYEEICGSGRSFRDAMFSEPPLVLSDIRENFRRGHPSEYRIGSRWDGHSKLYFRPDIWGDFDDFEVTFYPNFDPSERKGPAYRAARKAEERFKRIVAYYLRNAVTSSS
jgi:hypothetical protein